MQYAEQQERRSRPRTTIQRVRFWSPRVYSVAAVVGFMALVGMTIVELLKHWFC